MFACNQATFQVKFLINITENSFSKIAEVTKKALSKIKNGNSDRITTASGFLSTVKKGSKKFRKVLENDFSKTNVLNLRQVKTLYKNIDVDPPYGEKNLKTILALWNLSYLPSDIRTFVFKSTSNTLGLGARVQHINPDIDPSCSFCKKCNRLPAPLESYLHFFFYCPTTFNIISKYAQKYIQPELTVEHFFLGTEDDSLFDNRMLILVNFILRYHLWAAKLKNSLPNINTIESDMAYTLGILCKTKKNFEEMLTSCRIFRQQGRG